MFIPLPAYAIEQNKNWSRSRLPATATSNAKHVEASARMNLKALEEQEKLYAKKNKPAKPLLFDYYKTLYKTNNDNL